jgi:hypothetical protein
MTDNTQVPQAWTNVLAYALQDDMQNRLTPRVIDIAYNAFMQAKRPNSEDGGASDWFNDTRPMVKGLIDKLRKDIVEQFGAAPLATPQLTEAVRAAMKRSYRLGQTYWQQADHEFISQQKKADATQADFNKLLDDTVALVEKAESCCDTPALCELNEKCVSGLEHVELLVEANNYAQFDRENMKALPKNVFEALHKLLASLTMPQPLRASGIPETIEQYQLALDAAFAAGRASLSAQLKYGTQIEAQV